MPENSDVPSIIITGGNGLVGSHFLSKYQNNYDFELVEVNDPVNPINITNEEQIKSFIFNSKAEFIVHFAAFTDVTAAWNQKDDKSGLVYKVNVTGTEYIAQAAKETGKHLIHISTAYVFDGEKEEMYTEDDPLNPIEWYGQTKAYAEEVIHALNLTSTILRIDQPFRSDPFPKVDTAHRIIQGLQNDSLYPQFNNHFFGPTFIDDFSKVLNFCIENQLTGLFHASSGEKWSDFEFAEAINQALELGKVVKKGDVEEYLKTISRPYQRNTAMDTSKLVSQLDFSPTSIKEALKQISI